MALGALFVLVGRLAGAAKEMAVAWRYGVSEEVDAYLFVFNLVNLPVAIWFSVLTVVLIPLAAQIRAEKGGDISQFRAELLGFALLLAFALTLVFKEALPLLLDLSWAGLTPETVGIAIKLAPVLMMIAPLGILIALFSAWTMARGLHTNTLLEGLPAVIILGALLLFPRAGLEPLIWGTVVGIAFQLTLLAIPFIWRGDIEAPRFLRHSPHWRVFWQGFGIVLAGQALISAVGVMDQIFAAHIGTGAIATLGYANRIIGLILGIGATAISRSTLPIFSSLHTKGGHQSNRVAAQWARLLFVLGLIAMAVGWTGGPWVVHVLFERGTFNTQNTAAVTAIFRYGLFQLPFYFSGIVLVSFASSRGKYKLLFWSSAVGLVTKIIANLLLSPVLGVQGIVLAAAIMYMATSTLFWIFLWRDRT
jgi:putative peptidoglycan lipid II flippase